MVTFPHAIETDFDAATVDGSVLSWAARNSSKPGRGGSENWVLHASESFSQEHLEELRQELQRRRERLTAAARERQVMEELRKTEWRAYQVVQRRAEAKEYDEIAIRKFLLDKREKIAASPGGTGS